MITVQYRKRTNIAKLFDMSPRTVDKYIKEMEGSKRYPEDFCLKDVGSTLIEEEAFRDYLRYRRTLKSAPRLVPKYLRAETPEEVYLIRRETR